MGAVNPEDLGPGGVGREAGSSEHGPRSVWNIFLCCCGKAFPEVLLRLALRVPVSLRVLRARQRGMHDSLATCVILEPRVFIADFNYLFHGRQRHLVSFYNLLMVIE